MKPLTKRRRERFAGWLIAPSKTCIGVNSLPRKSMREESDEQLVDAMFRLSLSLPFPFRRLKDGVG